MKEFHITDLPVSASVLRSITDRVLTLEDLATPGAYEKLLDINGVGITTAVRVMAYAAVMLEAPKSQRNMAVLMERAKARFGEMFKIGGYGFDAKLKTRLLVALDEAVIQIAMNHWGNSANLLEEVEAAGPPKGERPVGNVVRAEAFGLPFRMEPPPTERRVSAVYIDDAGPDSPRAAEARNTPHGQANEEIG